MINSSLFVTLLEKRKRIKQIGGAQRNPYISKHLETKMSFRIEKQPLLYDPEKEISKLTKPQGQLRKLRGYQPNSQNTTHPHFFFLISFSRSLSLSWRCLYLVAKVEGVAITSTPHLPSFSHKNKFKKTTKKKLAQLLSSFIPYVQLLVFACFMPISKGMCSNNLNTPQLI